MIVLYLSLFTFAVPGTEEMLNKYLLNKQRIPTIQIDICRVAFVVCGCFPIEANDLLLFQMVPCGLKGWLHLL